MDGKDTREINAGASMSGLQQSEVYLSKKILLKNFAFIVFCEDFVITIFIFFTAGWWNKHDWVGCKEEWSASTFYIGSSETIFGERAIKSFVSKKI